jgi:uncharacterized protein (DUF305 family)
MVCAASALVACAAGIQQAGSPTTAAAATARPLTPAELAKSDSGHAPYTSADVHFMQGMIAHHAQAVTMAGWAPTHGASPGLRTLASRIDVSQRDEIAFMQNWLRDRHETVPDPLKQHADMHMDGMSMPGMDMSTGPLMPGMLTPEQMAQLGAAHGTEFDRLFLTFMIQHHTGALTMVDQLFSSPGAAQDIPVFRFASDVNSDQTSEIDRMNRMLAALPDSGG